MRDNSPAREPDIDTPRRPPFEVWQSEDCDNCHSTDDLGEYHGFTLCRKCRRAEL